MRDYRIPHLFFVIHLFIQKKKDAFFISNYKSAITFLYIGNESIFPKKRNAHAAGNTEMQVAFGENEPGAQDEEQREVQQDEQVARLQAVQRLTGLVVAQGRKKVGGFQAVINTRQGGDEISTDQVQHRNQIGALAAGQIHAQQQGQSGKK